MSGSTSKTKSKIWLTLSGIAAVLAIFIFAVIAPLYRNIADLRGELDSSEQAVLETEARVRNYQAAVEEFRRIESGRGKITEMFPEREEMVVLVRGLESVAANAGASSELTITDELENPPVKVVGSQEEKPASGIAASLSGVEEIPYKITLNGSYRDLIDFFLGFEHLPFVSSVNKISVSADAEQNEITETLINTGSGTAVVEGTFFIRSANE